MVSIFLKVKELSTNRLRWVFLTMILDHKNFFVTRRIFYARRIFYTCWRFAKNGYFGPYEANIAQISTFWATRWSQEVQNNFLNSLEVYQSHFQKIEIFGWTYGFLHRIHSWRLAQSMVFGAQINQKWTDGQEREIFQSMWYWYCNPWREKET